MTKNMNAFSLDKILSNNNSSYLSVLSGIYIDFPEQSNKDALNNLQKLWDDFGFTQEYKLNFVKMVKNLNENDKNYLIKHETNEIKNFRDAILNLKREIASRENNLLKLKKININLGNINSRGKHLISIDKMLVVH